MRLLPTVLLSLTFLFVADVMAADNPDDPGPKVVELTIYPSLQPEPVTPYRLLPEMRPGNAVGAYTKALMILGFDSRELSGTIDGWLKMPLDSLPRDEARATLARFDDVLAYIDIAARRSQCHWDPPMDRILSMLAPEIQAARFPARLIALRARLQIAEGDYEEALASLQTGYSMARQIAEQPLIVGGLVGTAIGGVMTDQVETLVTQPDAPHLYWALTSMPRPLIELKRHVAAEAVAVDQLLDEMLPALEPSQLRKLSASEVRELAPKTLSALYELYRLFEFYRQPKLSEEEALEVLQKAASQAKEDLIARGFSADEVEALDPGEAVVWDLHEMYRARRDQLKWFNVPYWQARKALEEPEAVAARTSKSPVLTSFVDALLPSVEAFCYSQVVREQQRAAVRCIEAIRLHVAAHEGDLPASLDEIEMVPVPINPATGEAFGYRLEGQVAILDADGIKPEHQRQYRIGIAK
jgi:tetratricopeptide (TPR) repeat protein